MGIGPGSDFVSTLFAAADLDGIEAVAAREAVSRFGLRKLQLHRKTPDDDNTAQATDSNLKPLLPIDARRMARGWQRTRFDLHGAPHPTTLSVEWPHPGGPDPAASEWQGFLAIVSARVRTALELEDQRLAGLQLEKTVRVQTALYRVANLASAGLEMPDMLRRIHDVVGELMYARNFYIALYDGERDSVRFIYFADAKDTNVYETNREVPAASLRDSLTLGLIRHGSPVRGPAHEVASVLQVPSGIGLGTPALDFLGGE